MILLSCKIGFIAVRIAVVSRAIVAQETVVSVSMPGGEVGLYPLLFRPFVSLVTDLGNLPVVAVVRLLSGFLEKTLALKAWFYI